MLMTSVPVTAPPTAWRIEDPLTGTLAAFGTYFIGFVGRPIGAAIFGHYGDRIGIIRTFGTWGTGDGQLRSPRAPAQQQPHRGVEQPPGDQASR